MFTKIHFTHSLFLRVQLLILGLFLAVFLFGDRSQPKLITMPDQVRVNGVITMTFDRAISLTDSLALQLIDGQGEVVETTNQVSGRTLVLSPLQPLHYGTEYQVILEGISDRQGRVLRTPDQIEVHTQPGRFLYLTPDRGLHLYDINGHQSKQIVGGDWEVLDYARTQAGNEVLLAYRYRQEPSKYGLARVQLASGVYTTLQEGYDLSYGGLQTCGVGDTFLAVRSSYDERGFIERSTVVTLSLGEAAARQEREILQDEEVLLSSLPSCSPVSDQVMYLNRQGGAILGTLSEPRGELLGRFESLYGFSEQGEPILGTVTSASLPTNRMAVRLTENGIQEPITDAARDTAEVSVNPATGWVAVSESLRPPGIADFDLPQRIVIRSQQGELVLPDPPPDRSDRQPVWSLDGRHLLYSRINQGVLSPQVSGRGSILEGELWLYPVSALDQKAGEAQPLALQGGQVVWLP